MKQSPGSDNRALLGKVFYGLLFCLAVPAYLVFWATRLDYLTLPAVPAIPTLGWALSGVGVVLMVSGISALWIHGHGLPMNAYPPPKYVQQGIFRWLGQPIYFGFVLACLGLSLALKSEAGLWVVSPVVALACLSLVYGYERPDLLRRFGSQVSSPWIRLPPGDGGEPTTQDVISVFVLAFIPWLVMYEVVEYIGVVPPVLHSTLAFEKGLPVWGVWILPYVAIYPLVVVAPFFARHRDQLREFAVGGLVATAIVIPFYLTVPVIAPFREMSTDVMFGDFLSWQQKFDRPVTAFPAFHVIWLLLSIRLYVGSYPALSTLFRLIGLLVTISCWATGMHALLDIFAGIAVYVAVVARHRIWSHGLNLAERIANSWQEWRLGSTRVINHGLYAGAAATIGFLIVGYISEPSAFWVSIFIGLSILLGAGIWGQILVGSQKLQRPFGYYGGVLGAAVGALLANRVFAQEILPVAAALSIAAPWIQATGRLRCLVQGCCHGAPTSEGTGIHYHHRRSRVLLIAGLGGQPLHPTPVYSIMSNILVGLVTMRLLLIGAPATFIIGTYLMLNGLARFVEEAYRGEPQTQMVGGLKIYQLTALTSFLAGTVISMVPSAPIGLQHLGLTPMVWVGSLVLGAVVAVAMGVDWPESNRRFSRLI